MFYLLYNLNKFSPITDMSPESLERCCIGELTNG